MGNEPKICVSVGEACPKCGQGQMLMRRNSRSGAYFVGCSAYPGCRFTAPAPEQDAQQALQEEVRELEDQYAVCDQERREYWARGQHALRLVKTLEKERDEAKVIAMRLQKEVDRLKSALKSENGWLLWAISGLNHLEAWLAPERWEGSVPATEVRQQVSLALDAAYANADEPHRREEHRQEAEQYWRELETCFNPACLHCQGRRLIWHERDHASGKIPCLEAGAETEDES